MFRTLLIEDSENDRFMLKRFLSDYCSSFHECGKLSEAVQLCHSHEFDLIIADLRLEDSDIDETLASLHGIRKLQPHAGMLVCSGMPIASLKERSLVAGADYFVEKTPALYRDSAKVLLLAVSAAMLHKEPVGRSEDFMRSVRLLQKITDTPI